MSVELVAAARDVLNNMFFTDILEVGGGGCSYEKPFPLQVRVGFAGSQLGEFWLEVDDLAACTLTGKFHGTDLVNGPSDEDVGHVIAELGNMICGGFLNRYEKEGQFSLSHPEVVRPAAGAIPGVHLRLELLEGFMELRVHWESNRK